jgi:SnoaL-like domain
MHAHQQLIENFYHSFQKLNWQGMIANYHTDVFFYDPVFENLNAKQAKAMWQMLCTSAKDFTLTYNQVEADAEYGSCSWEATYTFSKTGRKVTNCIRAHFKFHEGKIVEHMDDFDLWKWSRQALGVSGWLLGWSGFVQGKIRRNAKESLKKFIAKEQHKVT